MTRPWWRMVAGCLKGRWKGGGGCCRANGLAIFSETNSWVWVAFPFESAIYLTAPPRRSFKQQPWPEPETLQRKCSQFFFASFLFFEEKPRNTLLFSLFYLISFSLTLFWPHFRWLGFICCLIAPLGVFFFAFLWKKCDFYCDNLCIRKLWLITVAKCRGQITPTGQNDVLFIFVFGSANVLSAFSLFDPFKHKLCPEFVM